MARFAAGTVVGLAVGLVASAKAGIVEIGFTSRTDTELAALPVFQNDYVVVVPQGHAFAAKTSVVLKDLDGHRMLLSGGGCETLIQELLATASSNPEEGVVMPSSKNLHTDGHAS
jgi:DNA-binding transcriptional LysR family regulator